MGKETIEFECEKSRRKVRLTRVPGELPELAIQHADLEYQETALLTPRELRRLARIFVEMAEDMEREGGN